MLFNVFSRKLLGKGLRKIAQYALICTVVFLGLSMAEVHMLIATHIKYLMSGTFTAGIMWHSLSSENAAELSGVAMLPFGKHRFTFGYVGAYGLYIIISKTALLLSVMCAVSLPTAAEALGMAVCVLNGVLVTSAVYAMKKQRFAGFVWAAASVAAIFTDWALMLLAVNLVAAIAVLLTADPYQFINSHATGFAAKSTARHSVWTYLFRYMASHKNYLVNSAAMWVMAVILPAFMLESVGTAFLPMGFAILAINTPLCVLISADRALGEAIRFLPSGARRFCLPYGSFIAVSNLIAYAFYLASFGLQSGCIDPRHLVLAPVFALLGAAGSVLMEMKFPLTTWKTESDLWHHPRKYAVPAVLLVLAMVVCIV